MLRLHCSIMDQESILHDCDSESLMIFSSLVFYLYPLAGFHQGFSRKVFRKVFYIIGMTNMIWSSHNMFSSMRLQVFHQGLFRVRLLEKIGYVVKSEFEYVYGGYSREICLYKLQNSIMFQLIRFMPLLEMNVMCMMCCAVYSVIVDECELKNCD